MTHDPPMQPNSGAAVPSLHLNVMPLQGSLMVALQRLLDGVAVSSVGLSHVTEDEYAALHSFLSFAPAPNARLSVSAAAEEAGFWHLRTAFRDALEATGLYLDGCRNVAAICGEAAAGTLTVGRFRQIIGPDAAKFHRLGIPAKLVSLRQESRLSVDLMEHVLTINAVRNCLVHRLGVVSDLDVGEDGHLNLTYRALEFFGPDPKGGPDVIVDKPGVALPENAPLMLRARDLVKVFTKAERITLSYEEILQTFLTIAQFSMLMTEELRARAAKAQATPSAEIPQEA